MSALSLRDEENLKDRDKAILPYLSFETKNKLWVGGLSKNFVKPWA